MAICRLRRTDLQCLMEGRWLTDEVVNAALLCSAKDQRLFDARLNCLVMSSFFYTKLACDKVGDWNCHLDKLACHGTLLHTQGEYQYSQVKEWGARAMKVCMFVANRDAAHAMVISSKFNAGARHPLQHHPIAYGVPYLHAQSLACSRRWHRKQNTVLLGLNRGEAGVVKGLWDCHAHSVIMADLNALFPLAVECFVY